jgi:hypothetical protein
MSLTFGDVRTSPKKPKASIHKSGKLGFNGDAADVMDLSGDEEFAVAYDEDDGPTGDLYLVADEVDAPEESLIEVAKAGDYFYLNLRRFFDRQEVEYERYKFIYDIEEIDGGDWNGYHLKRRDELRERD